VGVAIIGSVFPAGIFQMVSGQFASITVFRNEDFLRFASVEASQLDWTGQSCFIVLAAVRPEHQLRAAS